MPENLETMMRVKRGEISLDEARIIIVNRSEQQNTND
jgi:hypothetical protein